MAAETGTAENLPPIFVSVKDAAKMLGVSPWVVYQLAKLQKLESRFHGRRRLIVLRSLREYADSLPEKAPAKSPTEESA